MESTLVPTRKFQALFREKLTSITLEFESKLTERTKQKLKEINKDIESKSISFSNTRFGRISVLEILEEISRNAIDEIIEYDVTGLDRLINKNIHIEIKTDEKGNSTVRSYDVELFIAKVRYLCMLIDHSIYFQHLKKFKDNLSFVSELYACIIAITTISIKVCSCCFRDLAPIQNRSDIEEDTPERNNRSRKYCHLHKCRDGEVTETQDIAIQAFNNLSNSLKKEYNLYRHIKVVSGDHLQLLPNTREYRVNELIKSASFHNLAFGNNPTIIDDYDYIIKNEIFMDLPDSLEGILDDLEKVKPESSKIFISPELYEHITITSRRDWPSNQQIIIKDLATSFPRTFHSFKNEIPYTSSLKEFTRVLQGKNFLDNEYNLCTHYYFLIKMLKISEELLIAIDDINRKERQERNDSMVKIKSRDEMIFGLHQQGANVSEIKRYLDKVGINTGRPTISKVIDSFK